MTWADESDLLLGDTGLGGIDTQGHLDRAADEIYIWLSEFYDMATFPTVGGVPALGDRDEKLLRNIQGCIATGRLLMAQAAGSSDESVHAYGLWLLESCGQDKMKMIGTTFRIEGATPVDDADAAALTPRVIQPNVRSPFERYEKAHYGNRLGPAFANIPSSSVQWWKYSGG